MMHHWPIVWTLIVGMPVSIVPQSDGGQVVAAAHAASQAARAPATAKKLPPNWLVQVAHVAKQDLRAQDVERIEAITKKLAEVPDGDAQRAVLERELQKERDAAESRRGFVVYGMRAESDAKGRPIEGGRSMVAFLLPPNESNRRTLGNIKADEFVLIPTAGSKSILTASGRAWVEARDAKPSTLKLDWGLANEFAKLPALPTTPPEGIAAALRFQSVKERATGEGYRYSLSFSAEAPPEPKKKVVVWYEVRYRTTQGETIGPVLASIELERGKQDRFSQSFGFDVIAPEGTTLDPSAGTVKVVAAVWE